MIERFFYGILGFLISYIIIRYRFKILEITGEFDFCSKYLGGTKNGIVLFGIFIFFISLLYITDNLDILIPNFIIW